jgi:TolB-like protein
MSALFHINKLKKIIFIAVFSGLAMAVFSQNDNSVSLDRAISGSMSYLSEHLDQGSRVAVLNFTAPPAVSNYIIEESIAFLVKDGKLTVVDRNELELLQREINFQLSGEVSDESAQSIGKKLGAQTIISGSLNPFGNIWRMHIRALEVETARVQSAQTYTIRKDRVLSNLISKTTGEKVGTGVLNIVFGLGSWLEGDIFGGLTLTAGYVAAAGLFVVEATALDWDNPAVGVPATIGVSVAGLTLAYGFVRPFIYNRSPKVVAFLDNMRIEAVPVSENGNNPYYKMGFRLSYSLSWQ